MNAKEKDKLKHDFLNSIVIINSLTKSASGFLNKFSTHVGDTDIDQRHMERLLNSMNMIRAQTAKIEKYFETLLDD